MFDSPAAPSGYAVQQTHDRVQTTACRHVQQPAAVVEVFAGVWPMLQAALGLYGHEPRPAERLCKVLILSATICHTSTA